MGVLQNAEGWGERLTHQILSTKIHHDTKELITKSNSFVSWLTACQLKKGANYRVSYESTVSSEVKLLLFDCFFLHIYQY